MESFLKVGKIDTKRKSASTSSKNPPADNGKKALMPWVEKYRPKKINEIAFQEEVVAVLRKSLLGADLPNLLFYGPPGTGKTSAILAAAKELFGELFKERVLELNASDERGIQVVREKVKNFSLRTVNSSKQDGTSCPPFKIVILDEADSMTSAAQAALRRTMEKETHSTRFCLICNYISRIIEPLTSRCSKFRFKPLSQNVLIGRLHEICVKEEVLCEGEPLNMLIEASDGDLRRAITFLQSLASVKAEAPVTVDDVNEITGRIPNLWVDEFLERCRSGVYDSVERFLNSFSAEGFSASQLLYQLHERVVFSDELTARQKTAVCGKIAVCDHRLTEGADEYLQLLDLGCAFLSVF